MTNEDLQLLLSGLHRPVAIIHRSRSVLLASESFREHIPEGHGVPDTLEPLLETCATSREECSALLTLQEFQEDRTVRVRITPLASQDLFGLYVDAGVERQPHRDPTTGLLNRHSLQDMVERELARSRREDTPMALLFIMLRNFKQINQFHGHHVGDLLLENTGIRCQEVVRQTDYVFRWEGTNLVVLLPTLASTLDVAIVAEKLYEAATMPYRFRDLDIAPGCHIGVALFPENGSTYHDLLNSANSAVIAAENQQEHFVIYDTAIHEAAIQRLLMRTGIQRGFANGEFTLYFQPIVDGNRKVRGAEALIRWVHPTRGLLAPALFLPLAEESQLITLIDKVALFSACRSLTEWDLPQEFFLTLNISARTLLEGTLPTLVQQAMESTGLRDPQRIRLEITESQLLTRLDEARKVLKELQDMGVETWIDDFGTGQSSLSYLKNLPVSTVKIAREFLQELPAHREEIEYLRSITTTITTRHKRIVIEGVASEEHYRLLEGIPADYLQGFFFGEPLPGREFVQTFVPPPPHD